MKRILSLFCAAAMLLSCWHGIGCYVFADDGMYTYVITGTVNYSKDDKYHNGETYRIEFWSDDPRDSLATPQKIAYDEEHSVTLKCGYPYKWTLKTPYVVKQLYVDIYYNNTLKQSVTIDNPQSQVALPTIELFESTTPVTPPKPAVTDTYWKKNNGRWYYYHQKRLMKGWQRIDGVWYYLDKNDGHMLTGWLKDGGAWYYLTASGKMATGWLKVGGVWYYFNASGRMVTGWQRINYIWYYFTGSGAMKTGWLKSGGQWYYLQSNGAMKCGWLKDGGKWYFLRNDGSMVVNAYVINDDVRFYFNYSGVCTNRR